MKIKKGYHRISQEEYNKLKELLKEYPNFKVANISGRSQGTIYYINRSTSLDNYRHLNMVAHNRVPIDTTKTTSGQDYESLDGYLAKLDNQIEELKSTIIKVIDLGVSEKVKETKQELEELREYRSETEKEINDLRELKEHAVKSNLAYQIKRSLLG